MPWLDPPTVFVVGVAALLVYLFYRVVMWLNVWLLVLVVAAWYFSGSLGDDGFDYAVVERVLRTAGELLSSSETVAVTVLEVVRRLTLLAVRGASSAFRPVRDLLIDGATITGAVPDVSIPERLVRLSLPAVSEVLPFGLVGIALLNLAAGAVLVWQVLNAKRSPGSNRRVNALTWGVGLTMGVLAVDATFVFRDGFSVAEARAEIAMLVLALALITGVVTAVTVLPVGQEHAESAPEDEWTFSE